MRKLEEAAREHIIKPAKSVNPKVKPVIGYPNRCEHYQALGYNLNVETVAFDSVYTGAETRDSKYTQQHLQEYQSYLIAGHLENTAPGKNEGAGLTRTLEGAWTGGWSKCSSRCLPSLGKSRSTAGVRSSRG